VAGYPERFRRQPDIVKNLPGSVFALDNLKDDLVTGGSGLGGVEASLDDQTPVPTGGNHSAATGPDRLIKSGLQIIDATA
jgi:hypothetical protein